MVCYLEWADQSAFMFEMEYEFFFGGKDVAASFSHPLILLPFVGQLLLVGSLLLRNSPRYLALIGAIMLCPLVFMIALAGALGFNWRILLSTFPFLISFIVFIRIYRKDRIKTPLTS
jgi:hypothetical protein